MGRIEKQVSDQKRKKYSGMVQDRLPNYTILDIKEYVYSGKKDTYVYYVLVKCPNPEHPAFWTDVRSLLHGSICRKCRYEQQKQKTDQKYNLQDLQTIVESKLSKGYTVLQFERRPDGTKYGQKWHILLKCPNPKHPEYWTTLNAILKGCGCRRCVEETEYLTPRKYKIVIDACSKNNCKFLELVPSNKHRFQAIVLKVEDVEGYWYNVTLDHLRNRKMNFSLKFQTNPYAMHNIYNWCRINRPDYQFCSDNFKNMSDIYIFKYLGNDIELEEDEKYFKTSFENFIYERSPHPALKTVGKSYGGFLVKKFLKERNIEFVQEKTWDDLLSKRGAHLFVDFFLPSLNMVIEVDGEQHFQPVDRFGGEEAFKYLQDNDQIKNRYCETHNIKLLRLPYYTYGSRKQPQTEYLDILNKWFK